MKVLGPLLGNLALVGTVISVPSTLAFSSTAVSSSPSLQSLLATHRDGISRLKEIARSMSDDEAVAPADDVFYLRYVLSDYGDEDEREAALRSSVGWRKGEGNAIVTSARRAVAAATAGGRWDNGPVRSAAPHSELISEYLQSRQCITTSLPSTKDLVYCIRAGKIDDVGLMSAVTVDQMIDFFLYSREVNSAAADMRSLQTDSLIKLVTCNDLAGVKLIGGSSDFRNSLSSASKKAAALYPSLNGRTLMLNPPTLLGALVKVFTPLFPKSVRDKLRFVSGPLRDVEDLREIVEGGSGRDEFVDQVQALAYGD